MSFAVPVQALAYFDTDARAWAVERIGYTVEVGGSSRDRPAQATFEVR